MSIEQLRASASQLRATHRRTLRRPAGLQAGPGIPDAVPDYASDTAIEERLLGLVFAHEDLREYATDLNDAVFEDATNRNLFIAWKASTTLDQLTPARAVSAIREASHARVGANSACTPRAAISATMSAAEKSRMAVPPA